MRTPTDTELKKLIATNWKVAAILKDPRNWDSMTIHIKELILREIDRVNGSPLETIIKNLRKEIDET